MLQTIFISIKTYVLKLDFSPHNFRQIRSISTYVFHNDGAFL